jgi:hypothetical protein
LTTHQDALRISSTQIAAELAPAETDLVRHLGWQMNIRQSERFAWVRTRQGRPTHTGAVF